MHLSHKIYNSIISNDVLLSIELIDQMNSSFDGWSYEGKSLLRWAVYYDAPLILKFLCKKSSEKNINHIDNDGYGVLSDCIFYGNIRCLEVLSNFDIDFYMDWDDKKPLYWALLYAPDNILCFMLDAAKVSVDMDSERVLKALSIGVSKQNIIADELS